MNTFYSLKIKEIKRETANAVSLLFDVPTEIQDEFKFTAGQYITIQKEIHGKEIRRAYSICSSPNSNTLKVAVKAIENGTFSVFATQQLEEGSVLEVSKPEGKFMLTPQANKNYIAFCAGSGITPILSMIQSVLENDTDATFTLIYGNKTVNDTIFYNEINALQQTNSEKLKVHYIFSQEQKENALFGRINTTNTNSFIKNVYKNTRFDEAFLCGPEAMITSVSETLQENGFTQENIKFELFTASIDEDKASEVKNGETQVTILLDDEETSFVMQQTDNVLSASLRNQIDAPYSCQGGVCSSCLAKVTQGKAVMVKNQILSADEVEEGFILTCQAHPTTAKIVVDFDDV